ncbi:MAG: hypothetical protein H6736_20110 [Alphaproteobacteria bacterium]|nr:hypothetical protein [Alphaproteobacteria bacterium]
MELMDRWVSRETDPAARRRARATLWVALLLAPWAPIIGGMLATQGAPGSGMAIGATALVSLAVPFLVRAGLVGVASHLQVAVLTVGLAFSAAMLGGVGTPPTAWLAIVPVLAYVTNGARGGLVWTGLVVAAAAALHVWQLLGGVLVPYLFGGWEVVGTVSCIGLYLTVGGLVRANDAITRQLVEQLEAARAAEVEANRAKSRFLANMSHEIRTPLNAMLGYTELVQEELEDIGSAESLRDLERVGRSGRHLLALINDILDMSKIEAGRLDVVRKPLSLAEVVRDVAESVRPLLDANQNSLAVEAVEVRVVADPDRVRQIALNLLSNAAKFTQEGTVAVQVVADPAYGWIHVRDTGIGMTPEQLQKVFDPFVQASDSTTSRFGGTGLGLSIASRLAILMEGELTATSRAGEGSCFSLRLPLANTPRPGGGP